MKSIIKILFSILLALPFFQCQFFTSKPDPRSKYEINFNEERIKRGIPIIGENYKRRHDTPAAYQLWVNMEETFPRHWRKYVSCDSDGYNIVAESDDFLVKWEGEKVVLSLYYYFEKERKKINPWGIYLYGFIPPKEITRTESSINTDDQFWKTMDSINKTQSKKMVEEMFGRKMQNDSLYHPEIENLQGRKDKELKKISLEKADEILNTNNLKRKKSL